MIEIKPMDKNFILWRCLHYGPLNNESIEQIPDNEYHDNLKQCGVRNVPLLEKLTDTYGACAMLAWDGDQVVGDLRFYPKTILSIDGAGILCMQQLFPAGPSEDFIEQAFPPLEEIEDKTLIARCLMTGSPGQKENPYQRKGIGTRMARELISWARERGWRPLRHVGMLI